jgi:hypothetical protein
MSNFDSRNSSYARKDVIFLVRVLIKARFLDSKATDAKFLVVLFTTRCQRNYVENFSSLGAIVAVKSMDFNFEPLRSICFNGHDLANVPKFKYSHDG